MARFVKRITAVQLGAQPSGTLVWKAKRKKKKRKVSDVGRPLEKLQRSLLKAHKEYAEVRLDRHNRSARKRKDGWLTDHHRNSTRARHKSIRTLLK